MKLVNPKGLKKFSKHVVDCQTHCSQLSTDVLELQGYLKQLSTYVQKYDQIKDRIANQKWGRKVPSQVSSVKMEEKEPSDEIGFSVKEDVEASPEVEVIEEPPTEMIAVITSNEGSSKSKTEKQENDDDDNDDGDLVSALSQIASNATQNKSGEESDDSEIGIYFIDDVKPVNFINIIQRELCTLAELYPDVRCIICEIRNEFDHFKVCCGCLKKVSPLLPDILKEIQELIKYIKKKRKEKYIWPNDSEYLRKTPEGTSKPFKKDEKDSGKKSIREETVGFVTIHTRTPKILKEAEASIKGDRPAHGTSAHARRYSIRVTNCSQFPLFQSETLTEVTRIEKVKTVEPLPKVEKIIQEELLLTEFDISQLIRYEHPKPSISATLQFKVGGCITYSENEEIELKDAKSETKFVSLSQRSDTESTGTSEVVPSEVLPNTTRVINDHLALQAKEFLLTARVALGEACLELQLEGDRSKMEVDKELRRDLKDLKDLMLEVHRNQIELSKVLLEKGVLNPAMVQLTDPQMLHEEREGIQKAKTSLTEAGQKLDNPAAEKLQLLVDNLKARCKLKNRMIMTLLKGLRSDIPRQHWEKLITYMLQESDSVQQLKTEQMDDFLKRGSVALTEPGKGLRKCHEWKTCSRKDFGVEEILSEREIKQTYEREFSNGKDTRISFSEILSKASKCLLGMEVGYNRSNALKSPTGSSKAVSEIRELSMEAEKLLKDLEREVSTLAMEHGKILSDVKGRKRRMSGNQEKVSVKEEGSGSVKVVEPKVSGSTTINLTIKIGDQDVMSRYQSALSMQPSGATLTEKKSGTSFGRSSDGGRDSSVQEFMSATDIPPAGDGSSRDAVRKSGSHTGLSLKFKLPVTFSEERRKRSATTQFLLKQENDRRPITSGSGAICLSASQLKDCLSRNANLPDFFLSRWDPRSLSESSNEDAAEFTGTRRDSDPPNLNLQMNVHYEQNLTIKKLRNRLQYLAEDLRGLRMTIDRMNILTDKLVDDASESSQNFKDIRKRYRFISSLLSK